MLTMRVEHLLGKGSPNFFTRGTQPAAQQFEGWTHYVMCLFVMGYVTFYQINKCFVNTLFFHY